MMNFRHRFATRLLLTLALAFTGLAQTHTSDGAGFLGEVVSVSPSQITLTTAGSAGAETRTVSLLTETKFTAGMALACWLQGPHGRLELLQVPQPHPAADAFGDEHYTGYYHLSLDVTAEAPSLPQWLDRFQQRLAAVDARRVAGQDPYPPRFEVDPDPFAAVALIQQQLLANI